MATKAEIKAKIQAQLTLNAGLTTHAQHEEFLHTEVESVLESLYPEVIVETQSTGTITGSNAIMDYNAIITKIGRQVTIKGATTNVSGVSQTSPIIFTINQADTSFVQDSNVILSIFGLSNYIANGVGRTVFTSEEVGITLLSTGDVFIRGAFGAGETATFEITYNTLN